MRHDRCLEAKFPTERQCSKTIGWASNHHCCGPMAMSSSLICSSWYPSLMMGVMGSSSSAGRCSSWFPCRAFLAGSKLFCLLQIRHLNHGGCRRIAAAILISRWQMRALWRALNLLYWLVCLAAHREAVIDLNRGLFLFLYLLIWKVSR